MLPWLGKEITGDAFYKKINMAASCHSGLKPDSGQNDGRLCQIQIRTVHHLQHGRGLAAGL